MLAEQPDVTRTMRRLECYAIGAELGLDQEAVDKVIARRDGDELLALRRLNENLSRRRNSLLRRHEQENRQREAEDARARYSVEREAADEERRRARQRMTLGQRVDRVMAESLTITYAGVGSTSPGGSQPDWAEPPRVNGTLFHGEDDLATDFRRRIELLVENFEQEIDAATIRQLGGKPHEMSTEVLDALLLRCEGWPSHVVATLIPRLGSPKTVERNRTRLGLRPRDGRKDEKSSAVEKVRT